MNEQFIVYEVYSIIHFHKLLIIHVSYCKFVFFELQLPKFLQKFCIILTKPI